MDTTVITEKQAREITGGRKPLVPIEYENAIKALVACGTIDDAKYWADKADALAAWARIYRNDEAGTEARRLKLHAYRRMGILAAELAPRRPKTGSRTRGGSYPGPIKAMKAAGLNQGQANVASAIAKIPESEFAKHVNSPRPKSPGSLLPRFSKDTSPAWKMVAGYDAGSRSMLGFRLFCRTHKAKDIASQLFAGEVHKAREVLQELTEWLDEFEQYLPKSTGADT